MWYDTGISTWLFSAALTCKSFLAEGLGEETVGLDYCAILMVYRRRGWLACASSSKKQRSQVGCCIAAGAGVSVTIVECGETGKSSKGNLCDILQLACYYVAALR